MTRIEALARLRAHKRDLRTMGIEHVAIFGSTARGEAGQDSDLDLAIRLCPGVRLGWDFFTLDDRIGELLGVAVDVVTEPAARQRLQVEIDRDRVVAFWADRAEAARYHPGLGPHRGFRCRPELEAIRRQSTDDLRGRTTANINKKRHNGSSQG